MCPKVQTIGLFDTTDNVTTADEIKPILAGLHEVHLLSINYLTNN